VEVQDETQHAVRRRVLGPEIHGEIAQISFSHGTQSECGVRIRATRYSLTFPVSRLLVPRQRIARTLPRRQEIEVAEFLRQPDRLVDDALLLVVVAHLDETGEGKILAQRMTLESVVREQPTHVRVPGKEHPVEIVSLALEPVGTGKDADDRG